MAVDSDLAVFGVGFSGGIANEILHWWGLRENPQLPQYAKQPLYWAVTLAMMLLGGALAWLQLGGRADGLIAFQIGLAAPMVPQNSQRWRPSAPAEWDWLPGHRSL